MRVFTGLCKDGLTGYQMIACDCSYNMAMELLQKEALKHGREIYRCENCNANRMQIYVGKPTAGTDYNGRPDIWYTNTVIFYYDEARGYLMKE